MRRLLLALALSVLPVHAFAAATLSRTLVSAGGAHASGAGRTMSSNVGDVIAGPTSAGAVQAWHGFYAPAAAPVTGVAPGLAPRIALSRPWPNPVRSSARVSYVLPAAEPRLELAIHDIAGRLVRRLQRGAQPAGAHDAEWDGLTERGDRAPAGIYLLNLTTSSSRQSVRLVVIP